MAEYTAAGDDNRPTLYVAGDLGDEIDEYLSEVELPECDGPGRAPAISADMFGNARAIRQCFG